VFESDSAFGQDLTEFSTIDGLMTKLDVGTCKSDGDRVRLQLVVPSASSLYRIRRIKLALDQCDRHTFRYTIEGWGLIQLDLGGIGPNGAVSSHTNNFSTKGARKGEPPGSDKGAVDSWNWSEVQSISSKLNRFIRNKVSVGKLGSRPVLPEAHEAFMTGLEPADVLGNASLDAYRASGSGVRSGAVSAPARQSHSCSLRSGPLRAPDEFYSDRCTGDVCPRPAMQRWTNRAMM
jgi:hypothetical protein